MSTTATAPSPPCEPAAVALALLLSVCPSAKAELVNRVAALDAELAAQIEQARLDTRITLPEFLKVSGRKAKLRSILAGRLEQMDPSVVAAPTPTALTVHATIRSVRRWRPGSELRIERAKLIGSVRTELDQVEQEIQTLTLTPPGHMVVPPGGHYQTGLVHQHDEWLRRAETLLARRASIKARLDRLDSTRDDGRMPLVKAAIDKAGGPSIVAESIRLASPAAAALGQAQRAVDTIVGQIAGVDPETERAALLNADLVRAKERLERAAEASEQAKAQTAGAIVGRALSGTLAGIAELHARLDASSELGRALDTIRGSDTDLVAVVNALMG